MNDLDSGFWRKVLLAAARTQHKYRPTVRNGGDISELLVKVNFISIALDLHADVIAGNAPRVSTPEEFGEQGLAIDRIRKACLFDTLLHRACRRLYKEAESPLRVTTDRAGRTVIRLDSNSETLPMGERGPDGQPEYWERRWIIERARATERTPDRFLRVERHRAGLIEQEAYRVDGSGVADVLIDLNPETKVPLAVALNSAEGLPEPVTATGVPYPLIVQLYAADEDGEPSFLFRDGDMDLLDMATASVSRLSREHEQHAGALLKVGESAVNRETGAVDVSSGAIVDDEGKTAYVVKDLKLEAMLGFMDRALTLLMTILRVSPALLGARLGGGATPDTYDKLRLESTQTLTRGRTTIRYIEPALERVFEVASIFDASRSFTGYPIAPVSVAMRAEIPKDIIDKVREQAELKREGLTSERRALIEIHGEDIAAEVQAEIAEDRARAADASRTAIFDAVPSISIGGPDDANTGDAGDAGGDL